MTLVNQNFLFLFILKLFFASSLSAQDIDVKKSARLLKSTLNSTALSAVSLTNTSLNLRVLQSVGQSGITSARKTKNNSVQQGFLNHISIFRVENKEPNFEVQLDFKIFPNPVVDYFNILFNTKPEHPVQISIFDYSGKQVYAQNFSAAEKIVIPIKEYSLAEGAYVLKANSGEYSNAKHLLKLNQ